MKLQQLVEKIQIDSDRIANPIGLPPEEIYDIMDELWEIEGAFFNVINKDSHDLSSVQQARKSSEAIINLGKTVNMAVSDLIPMEPGLDPEHLKVAHLNDKLAVVYLYKGKYYINDGNHRVASMFQRGHTHIKVNVVDVNDIISATKELAN